MSHIQDFFVRRYLGYFYSSVNWDLKLITFLMNQFALLSVFEWQFLSQFLNMQRCFLIISFLGTICRLLNNTLVDPILLQISACGSYCFITQHQWFGLGGSEGCDLSSVLNLFG